MQFLSNIRFSKVLLLVGLFAILAVYSIHEAAGNSGGVIGYSRSGCGGGCHSSSSATIVSLSTQATQIVAGQTYTFQLVVKNPSELAAGCDITADNSAKLATLGSGLQLYQNELTHNNAPRTFTGDSAVWTFKYTAPTKLGTAHIYAAGNAVNLDHSNSGDGYSTTTYTLTVVSASGISTPALMRDTVLTGSNHTKTVWVKNTSATSLTINRYGLKSGMAFQIADSSARSIAAGDSIAVSIKFAPMMKGQAVDTLHIFSTDAAMPIASTALVGLATAGAFQVSANPVDFGNVAIGKSSTVAITLKNTGNGILLVTPTTLSSPNPDFALISVSPPGLPPLTIQPNVTVTATFTFTPSKAGGDTSAFTMTLEDHPGAAHDTTVTLVGQGMPAGAVEAAIAQSQDLQVFPNPSVGRITVVTSLSGSADLDVVNSEGRVLFKESTELFETASLDLTSLPAGAYILRITPKDGQAIIRRIVIEQR